eukprot:TRINITY_DN18605_c0_g1_i1.p1 TRINITY_DN18605_c0_g1~~TRINITY_DN18605_c0_g1_i1.p1  ORF type:complete len:223 (+),score=43.42 TRINITY_DN18605_c0_g1_i1:41-709(+)
MRRARIVGRFSKRFVWNRRRLYSNEEIIVEDEKAKLSLFSGLKGISFGISVAVGSFALFAGGMCGILGITSWEGFKNRIEGAEEVDDTNNQNPLVKSLKYVGNGLNAAIKYVLPPDLHPEQMIKDYEEAYKITLKENERAKVETEDEFEGLFDTLFEPDNSSSLPTSFPQINRIEQEPTTDTLPWQEDLEEKEKYDTLSDLSELETNISKLADDDQTNLKQS